MAIQPQAPEGSPQDPDNNPLEGLVVPDTVHAGFENRPPTTAERFANDQARAEQREQLRLQQNIESKNPWFKKPLVLVGAGATALTAIAAAGAVVFTNSGDANETPNPRPSLAGPETPGATPSPEKPAFEVPKVVVTSDMSFDKLVDTVSIEAKNELLPEQVFAIYVGRLETWANAGLTKDDVNKYDADSRVYAEDIGETFDTAFAQALFGTKDLENNSIAENMVYIHNDSALKFSNFGSDVNKAVNAPLFERTMKAVPESIKVIQQYDDGFTVRGIAHVTDNGAEIPTINHSRQQNALPTTEVLDYDIEVTFLATSDGKFVVTNAIGYNNLRTPGN